MMVLKQTTTKIVNDVAMVVIVCLSGMLYFEKYQRFRGKGATQLTNILFFFFFRYFCCLPILILI